MVNMQDLVVRVRQAELAVAVEEDLYTRSMWIVCSACGQRLSEIPRYTLESVPSHSIASYFRTMAEVALERHACPVRIMELARRTPYTAAQVAAGISSAIQQSGQSAARAVRSFEESIARLNAVASVPIPCVRCGMATALGAVFCKDCLKLEEKEHAKGLKEETASKMRKAERSKIRVIRFEED